MQVACIVYSIAKEEKNISKKSHRHTQLFPKCYDCQSQNISTRLAENEHIVYAVSKIIVKLYTSSCLWIIA